MIFVCGQSGAQTDRVVSLKGVLYSNHRGPTGNSVGRIGLAVGDRLYELDYAVRYLKTRFKSPICWDIGAIWSVRVRGLSGVTGEYLVSAVCTGQVEENVHGPQQVALEYIDLIGKGAFLESRYLLSSRWCSSLDFKEYEAKLPDLDLSTYRRFGKVRGGCLDAVSVERPNRAELRGEADCYFELKGKPVTLYFDVVRNTHTKRWEIDAIRIEH